MTSSPGYFQAHLRPSKSRSKSWPAIVAYLARWVPPSARVLEVGAGYCEFINRIPARKRCALDISDEVRRHAGPGVDVVVADLSRCQAFEPAGFEAIFASNLFEHLDPEAVERALRWTLDRLAPGGRLICMQPNFRYAYRFYFDDYTHRSVYSHVSFPALLRAAGFGIVHLEKRFLPYSHECVPLAVPRFLVSLYLRSPWRPFAHQMLVIAEKPGA
ncbi:MAG: class I SAM-dependent methyltransferase [Nitrospirae bacterium]|nr:class I SAM-dependent methyltransferase [Nitrospirota bacterium]